MEEVTVHISVQATPDCDYASGLHRVPVDVLIGSDIPIEVASSIDVRAAMLTKIDTPGVQFGYARRILSAKRQTVVLAPESPISLRLDILEHDTDFDDLVPGEYRCEVDVDVHQKTNGDFRRIPLHGSCVITLT